MYLTTKSKIAKFYNFEVGNSKIMITSNVSNFPFKKFRIPNSEIANWHVMGWRCRRPFSSTLLPDFSNQSHSFQDSFQHIWTNRFLKFISVIFQARIIGIFKNRIRNQYSSKFNTNFVMFGISRRATFTSRTFDISLDISQKRCWLLPFPNELPP